MTSQGEFKRTITEILIERLKEMDDHQLVALFHDIDDVYTIEKIADCADYFLNLKKPLKTTNSELKEAKEIDDAARLRGHKADKRPY